MATVAASHERPTEAPAFNQVTVDLTTECLRNPDWQGVNGPVPLADVERLEGVSAAGSVEEVVWVLGRGEPAELQP
ncbi:hypothetical protein [Streptomyces melanogenes]|uniref:Uncharacterized protein n=1 Tax=Streptomyces melanogenes TaxID=67326 RepID=A0ABZ1XWA7_9ACTN|nr:hypothetical protein [Streptomyces melanogenes]